jgi:Putative beta-barrel porin 2
MDVGLCLAVLATALLGAGSIPLHAADTQPPPDPDLSLESTHRAGPFHLRPFFVLKDVGYDDNIRFEALKSEGDTTATAGTGLSVLMLTGDRGGIFSRQEVDYVAFGQNTDLNHWNGAGRARGILLLKRLVLSLEESYRSERERPNNEIDQRLRRHNNALTSALKTRGTGRLGLQAFVRRERIDYRSGDPTAETVAGRLNRNEDTISMTGELRIRPKTTFVLEGRAQRITFDDTGQGRDSQTRAVLPGFRFDPSAFISGEFRIGVTKLTALDQSALDYRTTTGEAALVARLGGASRIRGTYERDLVFSTLADNLFYVATNWKAAFEQFFTKRLSGEIAYGQGLNHYPNETTRSGVTPFQGIRDDRFMTYQIGARYRLNDQMALSVTAYRLKRDSTDDFYDRTRTFYSFGTTYDF